MVKKRFMVCVIDVTEDTVRIRMPDGTIGTLKIVSAGTWDLTGVTLRAW